jgi:hypothetical protein
MVAAQCCGDCNGDGHVTIDEILTAVNNALNGCIASPRSLTGQWSGFAVSVYQVTGLLTATFTQSGTNVTGSGTLTGGQCTYPPLAVSATFDGATFRGSLLASGVRIDFAAAVTSSGMAGAYSAVFAGPCTGDYGSFALSR